MARAKLLEFLQKERVYWLGARNSKSPSLAIFHRILKSQRGIAEPCLRNRATAAVRDSNRNLKSQKSRDFRAPKTRRVAGARGKNQSAR